MSDCIFCQIRDKKIPAQIIYEDQDFISFPDISPKAEKHFLIVPKRHIDSIDQLQESDKQLMGQMIMVAKQIAQTNNCEGYKLVANVGEKGGQVIKHIHLHLLSGENIQLP